MAYGTFPFNKIQLGREVTAGTAVAASSIWRGPATDIVDESTHEFAEEDVGILLPTDREYVPMKGARLALPETELTFEQVLHVLEAGIMTATPAGTGPYTYAYAFPASTTPNTIKTYTLETGNAVAGDVHEMEYGFVEEFTFSGAAKEAWKMASTWVGRQKTTTTFTGALSLATVEEALFNNTTLYIDATAGTIGTTAKAGVLTAASLSVKTGVVPVWTPNGALYFYAHKFTRPEVTMSITMELENTSGILAAQRAAWVAKTMQLYRLKVTGLTTSTLTMDLAGKYVSFGEYQNQDGNTVVEATVSGRYSAADALFCEIEVGNSLAAVP